MIKSTLLFFLTAALAFAQPPTTIRPGSQIQSSVVNTNFLGLYNGRVGRWSGAGAPANVPFSIVGDLYYDTTNTGKVYGCYRVGCTAVGANNWVLVSGAGVATTTAPLKGDGSGNAIAVTGTGTNCVLVSGSSGPCGSPAGSTNDFQVNVSGAFTGGRGGLDSSGNATFLGTVTTGSACSGCAGSDDMIAGTPAAVPANSFGWGAPATFTTSLRLLPPNAAPTANQVMIFGVPSSNVSTFAWSTPTITAGTNVTVTGAWPAWTVAATGGAGGGGVNAQTTSYGLIAGDTGKLVTMNGASLTATLYATPSSTYAVAIKNLNASALTISRNGLQINGGTNNITLQQYQAVACFSDGTNYFCDVPDVAGSALSITPASNGETIAVNITPTTCTAPQAVTAISAVGAATCTAPLLTQNSQSAAYTTVLADAGKQIYHPSADTTARTFTIAANASVAYSIGTCISFVNDTSAGTLTIAINTDTLLFGGAGTTGSRTLAASNIATACKITTTKWIITGSSGLT